MRVPGTPAGLPGVLHDTTVCTLPGQLPWVTAPLPHSLSRQSPPPLPSISEQGLNLRGPASFSTAPEWRVLKLASSFPLQMLLCGAVGLWLCGTEGLGEGRQHSGKVCMQGPHCSQDEKSLLCQHRGGPLRLTDVDCGLEGQRYINTAMCRPGTTRSPRVTARRALARLRDSEVRQGGEERLLRSDLPCSPCDHLSWYPCDMARLTGEGREGT